MYRLKGHSPSSIPFTAPYLKGKAFGGFAKLRKMDLFCWLTALQGAQALFPSYENAIHRIRQSAAAGVASDMAVSFAVSFSGGILSNLESSRFA